MNEKFKTKSTKQPKNCRTVQNVRKEQSVTLSDPVLNRSLMVTLFFSQFISKPLSLSSVSTLYWGPFSHRANFLWGEGRYLLRPFSVILSNSLGTQVLEEPDISQYIPRTCWGLFFGGRPNGYFGSTTQVTMSTVNVIYIMCQRKWGWKLTYSLFSGPTPVTTV